MNKSLIAAFALLTLTAGGAMAQRVYSAPYDNRPPQYGSRYDNDQFQDELKIERLDAIVGLSNRQERELHRIEDQYDQQMARTRTTPAGYRQLQQQKQQAMLSVLTRKQRERLFAQQQYNQRNRHTPYGRRG
ncbi:hypothetical protein HNV11_06825 [Spirosoma taeanense]|uniref:Periplasmic heavy metal sensor n=1 Tax=Spirosoma taeanense TaxID=2735870 RepID=A0A6M5Y7P1_9BACT|nr:hypothetical protein [Spirosoma taeanense]QJW89123.1 hypothetical protein HNV11_06825 [Spirosoma taeanense]